jgi:hypothetical protein
LRHVVRFASPAVAKRVSARIAVTDRVTERARNPVTCRALVFQRGGEPAVEPRCVSSADDDVDGRARHDHDHGSAHDDIDGTADHDDDRATATTHHDDDHCATTATGADGERRW